MLSDDDKAYVAKLKSDMSGREPAPLPEDAGDIRDYLLDFAKRIMKEHGELHLVAMIFLKSGLIFPLILDSEPSQEAKDGFASQVRALTVALDVHCVSIVMEAWVAAPPPGKLADVGKRGISHLDSKQEVVFISGEWADTATMWCYGIDRNDKGECVDLSPFKEYDDISGKPAFMPGRFGELMAPQPVPNIIRKAFREVLADEYGELFTADEAAQAAKDNKLN